jgi:hypothetical protein
MRKWWKGTIVLATHWTGSSYRRKWWQKHHREGRDNDTVESTAPDRSCPHQRPSRFASQIFNFRKSCVNLGDLENDVA